MTETPAARAEDAVARPRGAVWLPVAVAVAIAVVFSPVLLHPTDVVYSPYSDILAQHYPFRHLMVESLHRYGRLPAWNPSSFCGMPLVGDPQAGLFYPPNWLHALVPADRTALMFGPLMALHLLLGGWGMVWWLRGHDFSPAARLAGALAFVFCGKWFYHVVVPGHVIYLPLMWLPWQCGLLDRLWERPTLPRAGALAGVTALAVIGLHPQLLFYTSLMLVGYAVVRGVTTAPSRPAMTLALLVGATLLALTLAAVELLPSFAILDDVVRGAGLSYADASRLSIAPRQLLTFVLPSQADASKWENTSYVGVVAVALALFGWTCRRKGASLWYFYGVVVGCLWFALGEYAGLHWLLHEYVPGFRLFRIPSRSLLLLGLPVGYLAAAGLGGLCQAPPTVPRRLLGVVLAAVGFALLAPYPTVEALWAAGGLCVPLVCQFPWPARRRAVLAWAVALALFADQARFALPLVETRPLDRALPPNPVVDRLRAPFGGQRVFDVNLKRGEKYTSLPITYSSPADIESILGFNPLVPRSTFRYLNTGVGQKPLEWVSATRIKDLPLVSRPHLDVLNVRWIVANQLLAVPGLELRESWNDLLIYHFTMDKTDELTLMPETYLYENTAVLPRAALVRRARAVASVEEAIEQVGSLDPRREVLVDVPEFAGAYPGTFLPVPVEHLIDELRLAVDAGDGGYLFLAEMWYPGWRAWDNGQPTPIAHANGVFQALRLGSGRHDVVFRYDPPGYALGRNLTLLGIVLLVLCFAGPRLVPRNEGS